LTNLQTFGNDLINILSKVNESIITKPDSISKSGTTTFLGGVLFNVESSRYNKVFVGISVGNFKVYHWSKKHKKVKEISAHEDALYEVEGCLGSFFSNNSPNLCDIKILHKSCSEGDNTSVITRMY